MVTAASLLTVVPNLSRAEALTFTYETPREFFGSGDLDGDGHADVVIVDKETGKIRVGYQSSAGLFTWVDNRPSGMKGIGGFTLGKLLSPKFNALAFASADANQLTIVDASSTTATGKPLAIPFDAALGPNTIAAVDVGGEGNKPAADFYVASIYNSPDPNLATLLRNDGAQFPKVAEGPLSGAAVRANALALKAGQAELLVELVSDDKGDTLQAQDLSSGKPVTVATVTGLAKGSDYAVGNFRGGPTLDFLIYKPGESKLAFRPVEESAGKLQFGSGSSFDLGQPVQRVVTLSQGASQKLFVIFDGGKKAGLFTFDGKQAPVSVQSLMATNDLFTAAASLPEGFAVFSQPASGKFSTRYYLYKASGATYAATAFGSLPSLADNDNITIPDIHARIAGKQEVKAPGEMKLYTNSIPGTHVAYVMVPIPAGEFTMGSPEAEAKRKADEGPQHKVKIEPFWMGQCEVTWNEYELFMYPDEEKRTRAIVPTDAAGDKLADAVTHPSKPYVEMSFGMG
ncbi:MAG TPA: SUMF1/EgtB/PvdO family nonheme iron enzyme, partial [Candidatus Sulfotelmatobacter sp.]|nr:SUMF1/EgtB/PvdO family nonheme iron enzyme [Candidatus Sulfotelmatobacter sp.]